MLVATTRKLTSRQEPVADHGKQPEHQEWFGEEFGHELRFAEVTPIEGGGGWDVRLLVDVGSILRALTAHWVLLMGLVFATFTASTSALSKPWSKARR